MKRLTANSVVNKVMLFETFFMTKLVKLSSLPSIALGILTVHNVTCDKQAH